MSIKVLEIRICAPCAPIPGKDRVEIRKKLYDKLQNVLYELKDLEEHMQDGWKDTKDVVAELNQARLHASEAMGAIDL